MKTYATVTRSGMRRAFTLIELLAVVVVILLLAGITIGAASYVQRRMAVMTTKAQLAAFAAALEAYKSDWGYYPVTYAPRISNWGEAEARNNNLLYRALTGATGPGAKVYLRSQSGLQAQMNTVYGTNSISGFSTNNVIFSGRNWFDPFGKPYNYYNSPKTAFGLSNNIWGPQWGAYSGYTVGGQVNVTSYDLFSYGPDHITYVPGANTNWFYNTFTSPKAYVATNAAANDDITNWKR